MFICCIIVIIVVSLVVMKVRGSLGIFVIIVFCFDFCGVEVKWNIFNIYMVIFGSKVNNRCFFVVLYFGSDFVSSVDVGVCMVFGIV